MGDELQRPLLPRQARRRRPRSASTRSACGSRRRWCCCSRRSAWRGRRSRTRSRTSARPARTYAYVLTYLTVVTAWVALALDAARRRGSSTCSRRRSSPSRRASSARSRSRRSRTAAYIVIAIGVGRARRTQFNWVVTGAAAAVNVALNLALIPPYGMMGAAIATVAAYSTMVVGMAWWSQRIYPVPYQWRRVATAAVAAVGLAVIGKELDAGLAAAVVADARLPARAPRARLHEPGGASAADAARHAPGLTRSWPAGQDARPYRSVCSQQEDVEPDDQRRDHDRDDRRRAPVDERAHERAVAAEPAASGISANGIPNESTTWLSTSARDGSTPSGDDHERRGHRDRAAQEQRDAAPDEPLHHDLPGQRPDARRGEAGREQRDAEEQVGAPRRGARRARRRPASRSSPTSVSPFSWNTAAAITSMLMLTTPGDRPSRSRRRRARSGRSGASRSSVAPDDPVLRERGVQVDHVRHHGRAEDPDGEQDALRALEAGHEARCATSAGSGSARKTWSGEARRRSPR